jgi:hypothetical protein
MGKCLKIDLKSTSFFASNVTAATILPQTLSLTIARREESIIIFDHFQQSIKWEDWLIDSAISFMIQLVSFNVSTC